MKSNKDFNIIDNEIKELSIKTNDNILVWIIKKYLNQITSKKFDDTIFLNEFNLFDIMISLRYFNTFNVSVSYYDYKDLCLFVNYKNNLFKKLEFSYPNKYSFCDLNKNDLNLDENYHVKALYTILVKNKKTLLNKLNNINFNDFNYCYLEEEEVKENN